MDARLALPDRNLSERELIFGRHLSALRPGRLLDIATGHGKFAILAHELGWDVTAMDVRDVRFPDHPGVNWTVGDVRTFNVDGYDVISNLGLLYHLELDAVIDLLGRCAPTPMLLDTHLSLKPDREVRGYPGHLFREVANPDELEATSTASWGNQTSYWPTEEALLRMLRDVGYHDVYQLAPYYQRGRTFFWCL
jgi:hypothetical protein